MYRIIKKLLFAGRKVSKLMLKGRFDLSTKVTDLSVMSNIDAIFLVVGAFICSNNDSRFIHFASQNLTSVIGPG